MSRDGLGQPREMYFGAVDGSKEADVRFDRDGLGLESRRAFKNGIEVEWSRDVADRPTARRTFKRSLAAAAMGFAVGMLATPSYAQPAREEVDARVYQWRGEDQIAGIVDAASGPKFSAISVETGSECARWRVHSSMVTHLAHHPERGTLLSSALDGTLCLSQVHEPATSWDAEDEATRFVSRHEPTLTDPDAMAHGAMTTIDTPW